jgi:hypothetical protein
MKRSHVRIAGCLWVALFSSLALTCASNVRAESDSCTTPYVGSTSRFYEDLARLSALGLTHPVFGHGNVTMLEAARLIEEAKRKFETHATDSATDRRIENFLGDLEKKWGMPCKNRHEIHPADLLGASLTAAKISPHRYLYGIDADYSPLTQNKQGRKIHPGSQFDFDWTGWLRFTPHFSAYASSLLQLNYFNDGGPQKYDIFLQEAYVSSQWVNTRLDVGRRELLWGQMRSGGFLLSSNARPLDVITISNPSPFDFGRFGQFRYSFFVGNLGPDQALPYAFLSGGKLTYQPFKTFQFGIARALIMGGNGSPPGSFFDYFREFFAARQQREFVSGVNMANLSNSLSGFETRVTLPFLKNLSLYGEAYFEDFTMSEPLESFLDDTALLAGAELPALDRAGSWGVLMEYRRTAEILYSHAVWVDGWTLNDRILGDPLGPEAESLHVGIRKYLADEITLLRHDFYFEALKSDVFLRPSTGRSLLARGTTEYRVRNLLSAERPLKHGLTLRLQGGHEFVQNYGYAAGNTQNDVIAIARIEWRPELVWRP